MVVKTIISAQPILAHNYKLCQPDDFYNHMCFEILGFDFLINSDSMPVLLEVNHAPSFAIDTPFDKDIKTKVIYDTIQIMNVTKTMKNKLVGLVKKDKEIRVKTGIRVRLSPIERDEKIKECQSERDQHIEENLGGFEIVYPLKNKELETEPYD